MTLNLFVMDCCLGKAGAAVPNYFVRADLIELHFEVPLAEKVLT